MFVLGLSCEKFTSDYVRASTCKQIFPELENVNQNNSRCYLTLFSVIYFLLLYTKISTRFFFTLKRVSTYFKYLLGTFHNCCPNIYLNNNVMCLLEGKSMLLEVIRHNWSHRQLSRVSGSGSGLMMELRNLLRPILS